MKKERNSGIQYLWNRHAPAVAGALLALVVLLVDVVISVPSKDSIVLSLLLLLGGLLFDTLDQLAKQEHRIADMLTVERNLLKDTWLGEKIRSQIRHYAAILAGPDNQEIIVDEARRALNDAANRLQELAKEEFRSSVSEEVRMNREFLRLAHKEFLATSYVDLSGWWEQPEVKKYLEEHKDLIERQCRIQRVFIVGDSNEEAAAREEGHRQSQIGINCYIAKKSDLRPEHQTDFIVADEIAVSITHLTRDGTPKDVEVSFIRPRVLEHRRYFKEILANGEPIE